MGNDPNPLGNDFNLFIPKFKILNLLIPDKDVGTSFRELLKNIHDGEPTYYDCQRNIRVTISETG